MTTRAERTMWPLGALVSPPVGGRRHQALLLRALGHKSRPWLPRAPCPTSCQACRGTRAEAPALALRTRNIKQVVMFKAQRNGFLMDSSSWPAPLRDNHMLVPLLSPCPALPAPAFLGALHRVPGAPKARAGGHHPQSQQAIASQESRDGLLTVPGEGAGLPGRATSTGPVTPRVQGPLQEERAVPGHGRAPARGGGGPQRVSAQLPRRHDPPWP